MRAHLFVCGLRQRVLRAQRRTLTRVRGGGGGRGTLIEPQRRAERRGDGRGAGGGGGLRFFGCRCEVRGGRSG